MERFGCPSYTPGSRGTGGFGKNQDAALANCDWTMCHGVAFHQPGNALFSLLLDGRSTTIGNMTRSKLKGEGVLRQSADPPMIVRAAGSGGLVRVNAAFREKVGFSSAELAQEPFLHWIEPEQHALVRDTLEGRIDHCRVHHRARSGNAIPLDVRTTGEGQDAVVLGSYAVASAPEALGSDSDSVDEATVLGTLDTIARIIEEQNPGYKCSILLVADGRFVRGAGPSLPEEYNAAIDGYAIGPTVGSCGTAIYWGIPVIVEDIQADPLWSSFAELAKTAGVASCWSHPFTSKSGSVLGALAFYSSEPQAPTSEQLSALRAAARMTGLAVERGRAEEALREQRKRELELESQLRQAAKMEALGVLAGGVAHDFNNVLATILANAEFALELSADDGEVVSMLRDIVEASKRAGGFCQQMLAYAGRETLSTSKIELGNLLPQLSSLVKAALSKKATLEYALQAEPVFVCGDENQLLQVIMNLVTNAADALGENEGTIVVASEIVQYDGQTPEFASDEELPAGEYVRLTVADNGCGMDADTVARVFDPFYTTKLTGRGLGLAAVQGIVRGHGGTIHLESTVGKGTTFTVLLPTTEGQEPEALDSETSATASSRKRVLVVDDEKLLRNILSRRLRHSGFDVVEACDGEEAIDIFTENPSIIDCVLLDLSMPKRGGEEVHLELRALREDVPIILMSGFTEREVLDRFKQAKLTGFLQKPVSAVDLVSMIGKATA